MSNIPNVREKIKKPLYANTKGVKEDTDRRNWYWQGYLNEKDAYHVRGYDIAVENVENAFNNFEFKAGELERFGIDAFQVDLAELLEGKWMEDYTDEEIEKMSAETKIVIAIRDAVLTSLELDRNDIVVSKIEAMSDAETEEVMRKADSGEYENMIIRAEKDNIE